MWERLTTRILASVVQPGDVVLDIGANIGWYACILGRLVGPTGQVHCFEPDARNASILRQNVVASALDHVTVHEVALADHEGSMSLLLNPTNLGDHRLGTPTEALAELVSVQTLDDVVVTSKVNLEALRVVKIDTQGAEGLILRGAQRTLRAVSPQCWMVIEFAPNLLAKHGEHEVEFVIDQLVNLGRPLYRLRKGSLRPTDAQDLRTLSNRLHGKGDEWAVDVLLAPPPSSMTRTDRWLLRQFRLPRPQRAI
jgi:FkbM family methyltransferase